MNNLSTTTCGRQRIFSYNNQVSECMLIFFSIYLHTTKFVNFTIKEDPIFAYIQHVCIVYLDVFQIAIFQR